MAIFEIGDMWSVFDKSDLFCITTNSTIYSNGELVMGAGFAKQAKDKFPALSNEFGCLISNNSVYGFTFVHYKNKAFGAFQTKIHFRDTDEDIILGLIFIATRKLNKFLQLATREGKFPYRVDLNYPGIGCGGLSEKLVYPIVSELQHNVHIWKKQ